MAGLDKKLAAKEKRAFEREEQMLARRHQMEQIKQSTASTRDGQNDSFPGTSSFSSVQTIRLFDSFVTSDYVIWCLPPPPARRP